VDGKGDAEDAWKWMVKSQESGVSQLSAEVKQSAM